MPIFLARFRSNRSYSCSMDGNERHRLMPEEIMKGNLVLFDHKEVRGEPCLPGNVEKIAEGVIYFVSGLTRKIEDCAPVPLNEIWLVRYGINKNSLPLEIKYVHQLQNHLGYSPKNNQTECAGCGKLWGWNDKNVFDFNLPVGKRIWPAICPECRSNLERRYKTKELNRTELMLEFSTLLNT